MRRERLWAIAGYTSLIIIGAFIVAVVIILATTESDESDRTAPHVAGSSDSSTSSLEPVTPLSATQRDEVVQRLNQTLIDNSLALLAPNEPHEICSNYEQANWDIDRVVDPLLEAAGDDAEAWRDYHNHVTLLAVLMGRMEQQGMDVAEQAAGVHEWLRAFCGSL